MPGLAANPATSFFTLPFRRHKRVYELNPPDEVYNVTYLGNVLTVMGKGEASIEKPLSVIWRTYNSKKLRREISMKLSITRSGLKADTKQGTTEYWANRVTYSASPSEYPRVFCWVYKHEGKRMKPDLRCHAVLCRKSTEPALICLSLNKCLQAALLEYKREKLTIEKARKNSLCGGIGPRRKILLQTGSLNFRTPMSRSKSAPRLGSIDEEDENGPVGEECDEEYEEEEGFFDIESMSYHNTPLFNDGESTSEYSAPRKNDAWGDKQETSSMSGSSSIHSSCSAASSSGAVVPCPLDGNAVGARLVGCGSLDENYSIDNLLTPSSSAARPTSSSSERTLLYSNFSTSCPPISSTMAYSFLENSTPVNDSLTQSSSHSLTKNTITKKSVDIDDTEGIGNALKIELKANDDHRESGDSEDDLDDYPAFSHRRMSMTREESHKYEECRSQFGDLDLRKRWLERQNSLDSRESSVSTTPVSITADNGKKDEPQSPLAS